MWMSCGNHIQASETLKSAYFNMSGFALPNFRQGNLGHPGLSMHASDPCDEEIQNHPKKISYHHNVTPSMIDFLFRHKGSLSRQSRPILSGITLPHPISRNPQNRPRAKQFFCDYMVKFYQICMSPISCSSA